MSFGQQYHQMQNEVKALEIVARTASDILLNHVLRDSFDSRDVTSGDKKVIQLLLALHLVYHSSRLLFALDISVLNKTESQSYSDDTVIISARRRPKEEKKSIDLEEQEDSPTPALLSIEY